MHVAFDARIQTSSKDVSRYGEGANGRATWQYFLAEFFGELFHAAHSV